MTIDRQTKLDTLSRILESPDFKDSPRSQDLLKYLFQASLESKSPKEITIAIEFFGKGPDFDPKEDPTVRVQMNNLRKKLEHYYLTAQDPGPYRLEIPKGHYVIQFEPAPVSTPVVAGRRFETRLLRTAIAVLLVVVVVLGTILLSGGNNRESRFSENPLWKEFFSESHRPVLIVLGDYFFLFDKSFEGKPGMILRNPLVNSLEDLRAATSKDPTFAQRFVQSEFTFLRPSAPWGVAEILPIVQSTGSPFSFKLASQLTVNDLKEFNVIFIGSFKTLHQLKRILHHFDLHYELTPTSVQLIAAHGDSAVTFYPQNVVGGEYERDYAVIAKGSGPDGNTVMMILGFGDSGVLQGTRVVADPGLPDRIRRELARPTLPNPLHCVLVLETEGINQTGFKATMKYFRALE